MRNRQLLGRLDEHMARGNELMARGDQLMEEIRAEHRLNRAAFHELRDVTRWAVVTLQGLVEESRETQARLVDMGAEIRANTRAVLHVLDELQGRGPGPSAASA
jgi:hypothetical protein